MTSLFQSNNALIAISLNFARKRLDRFGGVKVSVISSSHGLDPRSGQARDIKFCVCCTGQLKEKEKPGPPESDNMSATSGMFSYGLLVRKLAR